jgi:hypothetical protein
MALEFLYDSIVGSIDIYMIYRIYLTYSHLIFAQVVRQANGKYTKYIKIKKKLPAPSFTPISSMV